MTPSPFPAIRRLLSLLSVLFLAIPTATLYARNAPAGTAPETAPGLMTLGDVGRGQLLFRTTVPGRYARPRWSRPRSISTSAVSSPAPR